MSLSIVNGFVCRDCTDIAKAKRGEDPAQQRDGTKTATPAQSLEIKLASRNEISAGRDSDAGAAVSAAKTAASGLGRLVDITA